MTSFETVALIVLVILALAIIILKSFKNYNDGNEANDEEIKGYVFDGIRDIMSTIEVITGRTVEDTKKYVTEETVKKLTTLREESGIKFNLSEGTLTELITAVIDNNFENDINDYVKKCEVCNEEDCICDEEACDSEEASDIDTVEPTEEIIEEDDTTTEVYPEEEDEPVEEVIEESVEEPFDTLKDEEGNEVEIPVGNVEDEPAEIETEPSETEEVIEEEPMEETTEGAPVEEDTTEEEPVEESTESTEVHTTESCTCIECMTKPQIKTWAADHGIFVSSKMLKADMINKVKTEFEAQTASK